MTGPDRVHLGAPLEGAEGEEPGQAGVRIGVFVCHCGRNIGSVVDVPSVVEFARTLPNVEHAQENLYSCSQDGLRAIKDAIRDHRLDRVVVASCTPRTHTPLFQSACEEVGVNRYLFELVNIRDQCSWVHMHEPERATEKAKELVQMGVARTSLLLPLADSEIDVHPVTLVIGGGITGMTAAMNLASQGIDVHLVEREAELGGTLRRLYTLHPGGQSASDLLGPLVKATEEHPHITVQTGSEVEAVSGYIGNFDVRIAGKQHEVGTIVVATGADILSPEGAYLYGEHPMVATQLELEEMLLRGKEPPGRAVMIQCVGSRTLDGTGRPYCSKICCMTAIKNAILLKERSPVSEVYILYRDIMAQGVDNELLYREAMDLGVHFLQYDEDRRPQVSESEGGLMVTVEDRCLGNEVEIVTDLVVLSTPLVPREGTEGISKMLKVPLDVDGFFLEAHVKLRPLEFATDGMFVCGSTRFPMGVEEAVSEALGAAAKAAIPIRKGTIKGDAIIAIVQEGTCVGCGTCEEVCEFGAPRLERTEADLFVSAINPVLCKGCGVCAVACPSRAIVMQHFSDEQIWEQISAVRGGA